MFSPERSSAEISKAWHIHFLANQQNPGEMPWDDAYKLSSTERRAIQHSIQQFQLGESSEGRRLLIRARAYSLATNDPDFAEALSLFVKEEQRHSAYLLRFMRAQRIPKVSSHWVDSVFRRLRVLAGLELSLRVLVTAEIIAVPYYTALGRSTASRLLNAISSRIVQDEAAHLKFQSSMLSRLAATRRPIVRRLIAQLHQLFLIGTSFVVWCEHGTVFRAAGYTFELFLRESLAEFAALESPARDRPAESRFPARAGNPQPTTHAHASQLSKCEVLQKQSGGIGIQA
jgi:hypothetical protein